MALIVKVWKSPDSDGMCDISEVEIDEEAFVDLITAEIENRMGLTSEDIYKVDIMGVLYEG